tara:strand:- start:3972 stop:4295 length:324 start_codon:yes stop_codon:yes gene_type:complete
MTDQNSENTQQSENNVSQEREQAAITLANEFLNRATLGEALAQVSLSAVMQLVQNKAIEQGKNQVSEMTDDQVNQFLDAVQKAQTESAADEAVEEVSEKTSEAVATS